MYAHDSLRISDRLILAPVRVPSRYVLQDVIGPSHIRSWKTYIAFSMVWTDSLGLLITERDDIFRVKASER